MTMAVKSASMPPPAPLSASYSRWGSRASLGYAWLYLGNSLVFWKCQALAGSMIYAFEEYLLDAERRELRRGAALIAAEPQTFDLLLYLIQNRERVVSKDDLMAAVWSGRIVSESTLSSQIAAVRHAIGDDGERQMLVRTLPRKGFRFVGEVQEQCARERFSAGEAADTPQPTDRRDAGRNRIDRPERRQLSVMICNLTGAGALSSAQDPE